MELGHTVSVYPTITLIVAHQYTGNRDEYTRIGREIMKRTDDALAVAYTNDVGEFCMTNEES